MNDLVILAGFFALFGYACYRLGKLRGYNVGVMDGCAFGANEERTFRNGIVARARIDATRKAKLCFERNADDRRHGVALRPRLGRISKTL